MATSETALLQFVALALPAVAILMQAILSFQDRYGIDASDSIRTEFRFIELSFIALLVAAGLFSVALLDSLNSVYGRLGLLLMVLGIGFLAPATWFALRRPTYPRETYDSPEEAVKSGVKRITVLVLAILSGALVEYLGRFIPIPNIIDMAAELATTPAIALTFLVITYTFVKSIVAYKENQYQQRWEEEWYSTTHSLLIEMESFLPKEIPDEGVPFLNTKVKLDDFKSTLESLIEESPEGVDTSPLKNIIEHIEMAQIQFERREVLSDSLQMQKNKLDQIRDALEILEEKGVETSQDADIVREELEGKVEEYVKHLSDMEDDVDSRKELFTMMDQETVEIILELRKTVTSAKQTYSDEF